MARELHAVHRSMKNHRVTALLRENTDHFGFNFIAVLYPINYPSRVLDPSRPLADDHPSPANTSRSTQ
jgi:hypothetical protein